MPPKQATDQIDRKYAPIATGDNLREADRASTRDLAQHESRTTGLESEIGHKDAALLKLTARIETVEKDLDELRTKVKPATPEELRAARHSTLMQADITRLGTARDHLKQEKETLLVEKTRLAESSRRITLELEHVKGRLTEATSSYTAMEKLHSTSEQARASLETKLGDVQLAKADANRQIGGLEMKLTELYEKKKLELDDVSAKLAREKDVSEGLRQEIHLSQQGEERYRGEADNLRPRYQKLYFEYEALKEEKRKVDSEYASLTTAKSASDKKILGLSTDLSTLKGNLLLKTTEIDTYRGLLKKAEQQSLALMQDNARLAKEVNEKKAEYEKAILRYNSLHQSSKKVDQAQTKLQTDLDRERDRAKTLHQPLGNERSLRNEESNSVRAMQRTIEEHDAEYEEGQNKNSQLFDLHAKAWEQFDAMEKKWSDERGVALDWHQKYVEQHTKCEALAKTNNELRDMNSNLQRSTDKINDYLQALRESTTAANKKYDRLEERAARAAAEAEDIQKKLDEAEKKLRYEKDMADGAKARVSAMTREKDLVIDSLNKTISSLALSKDAYVNKLKEDRDEAWERNKTEFKEWRRQMRELKSKNDQLELQVDLGSHSSFVRDSPGSGTSFEKASNSGHAPGTIVTPKIHTESTTDTQAPRARPRTPTTLTETESDAPKATPETPTVKTEDRPGSADVIMIDSSPVRPDRDIALQRQLSTTSAGTQNLRSHPARTVPTTQITEVSSGAGSVHYDMQRQPAVSSRNPGFRGPPFGTGPIMQSIEGVDIVEREMQRHSGMFGGSQGFGGQPVNMLPAAIQNIEGFLVPGSLQRGMQRQPSMMSGGSRHSQTPHQESMSRDASVEPGTMRSQSEASRITKSEPESRESMTPSAHSRAIQKIEFLVSGSTAEGDRTTDVHDSVRKALVKAIATWEEKGRKPTAWMAASTTLKCVENRVRGRRTAAPPTMPDNRVACPRCIHNYLPCTMVLKGDVPVVVPLPPSKRTKGATPRDPGY